jgi:hypothetical protein
MHRKTRHIAKLSDTVKLMQDSFCGVGWKELFSLDIMGQIFLGLM